MKLLKKITAHVFTLQYLIVQVFVVVQCASRCDGLKRIHKKIVKNLLSKFYQNKICIFAPAIILKLIHICKMNFASYTFNTSKDMKHSTQKSSQYMSYSSHSYLTRNSSDMLLPNSQVGAVRMNFQYQFIDVWLETSRV